MCGEGTSEQRLAVSSQDRWTHGLLTELFVMGSHDNGFQMPNSDNRSLGGETGGIDYLVY